MLVFDFGSELYVWMGKNVDLKLRKSSVRLAKELWDNGFNYEECDLCPILSASTIGDRPGTLQGQTFFNVSMGATKGFSNPLE